MRPPGLRSQPLDRRSGCSSAEPYPPPRSTAIVPRRGASGNLLGHLARLLSTFAGFFQLAIPFGEDHVGQAIELVGRRDVADGRVQADVVVMLDEGRDSASRFLERGGTRRANALPFERSVPAFELAIGLRVLGARAHVGDPHDADELLEVPGDELRAVIADDPRPFPRVLFQCPLHDGLHVSFGHRFP